MWNTYIFRGTEQMIENKDYIVIVQCHIVKERCSGYLCEKAFNERTGGFTDYSPDVNFRTINMTCGGCCGLAVQRKLSHFCKSIKQKEAITKDRIIVQLSSCITQDSYHGPACPHIDYMKDLIKRIGLDIHENTHISVKAEQKRQAGIYTIRQQT
jgi:predicted metal-binding protein